jgi:hypothetical protein
MSIKSCICVKLIKLKNELVFLAYEIFILLRCLTHFFFIKHKISNKFNKIKHIEKKYLS